MIRVYPENKDQIEFLDKLQNDPHLDFWTEIGINRPVDIMVTPFKKSNLEQQLKIGGMKTMKMIENVEDLIQEERNAKPERKSRQMTWDDYYSVDQVF